MTLRRNSACDQTIVQEFIESMMRGCTHALTVTLKEDQAQKPYLDRRLRLEETIRIALRIIDRSCFRKDHKRLGLRIDSVVVIEGGKDQKRIHAHLALTRPPEISDQQFWAYVQSAVSRCKSLGEQYEIRSIFDSAGWASYLAKEGLEALSPQCTHVAKR
jgi:hypothetical protein